VGPGGPDLAARILPARRSTQGPPSSQGLPCSVGKRRPSLPIVISSGIRSGGWHANGPRLGRSAVPGGH
jgi:hypothetical protein